MGQRVHDFSERLNWSEAQSDDPFWAAVYRKAFPTMVAMLGNRDDNEAQRRGIDRFVALKNGRVLRIDEKKRSKDYPDMLLEHISQDAQDRPGWMEKDLDIDYLAYAFMPSHRCYLWDWLLLKRAWNHCKLDWLQRFPRVEAKNATYTTISVAVPIKELAKNVHRARIIDVSTEL